MHLFKLSKNIFYLYLPIIVGFIFELVFCDFYVYRIFNVVENLIFATILAFIVELSKNKKLQSFIYILLLLLVFFESGYFLIFRAPFSASGIFILLDTNLTEASEFLSFYSTPKIIFLLFTFIFLFLIKNKIRNLLFTNLTWTPLIKIVFILSITLLTTSIITKPYLKSQNLPFLLLQSSIIYKKQMEHYHSFSKKLNSDVFSDIKKNSEKNKKELHFILIGESTSRKHFYSASNYYRNTTPLLDSLSTEVTFFNNVISPETFTRGSLLQVLTLANTKNLNPKKNGSVLQMLNKAGYKTFWFSNQRSVSKHDTEITAIANGASFFKAISTDHEKFSTPLDGELLPLLEITKKDNSNKKVVFLHLQGTHLDYKKRYPKEFIFFTKTPKTKFHSKRNNLLINAYDNAIRYQDYIISECITFLKKENINNSTLLYFSDHGEEVFDNINFAGHAVDGIRTKNMYEIPFVYWSSKKFRHNIKLNSGKPYVIDNLIHSIAHLLDIKCREIDISKSIFNKKNDSTNIKQIRLKGELFIFNEVFK